jgi:hypothetical protein
MSTITPSNIDNTKPNDADLQTQDLRDVFTAVKTEFTNAATDVDANASNISTNTTSISNHIADTTDAHAASAITNTPAGTIAATTVQAAIDELDTEKAALTDLASTANGLGASLVGIEDSAGDFTATDVEGAFGEIFDQGSNANGEYIKFVSGYMICTKTVTTAIDINVAVGALYRSADFSLGSTSVSFVTLYSTAFEQDVAIGGAWIVNGSPNATITSYGAVRFFNTGSSTGSSVGVSCIATGTWK